MLSLRGLDFKKTVARFLEQDAFGILTPFFLCSHPSLFLTVSSSDLHRDVLSCPPNTLSALF